MTQQPILELRDLKVSYGKVQALHGVSFSIAQGEVVALIGSNGAGKSTSLRAISGLMAPSAGSILFKGGDISGKRADEVLRAGIAHCPEERHVWPEMTVEENLQLGGYIVSDKTKLDARVEDGFNRFPRLRERRKQLAGTLSGGEQQMLAIARALISEPTLLLLDEPSLGLSPLLAQEVMGAVRELQKGGMTILLVEQNVHNALSVASRAYVLETGRVVAADTSAALLGNKDVLRAYLGG
ncbi:ABC transporter ATP-binding protein [Ferrovibrio plantarum]|uniref:ABC transporter ATP-binding protein n=1 Tax=Ferrovibrio plantarum TaxID=3119164 RepID=UPI003F801DBB